MKRRAINVLTLVSLLLCAAVVALWMRSYGHDQSLSAGITRDRYTVRAANGRLSLHAPPPRSGTAGQAGEPAALAARTRNDQILWYVHHEAHGFFKRDTGRTVLVAAGTTGAAGELGAYRSDGRTLLFSISQVCGPLFDALEKSERFAAAHVLLAKRLGTEADVSIEDLPDGACVATIDGLRVVLRPTERYVNNRRIDTVMYLASAEIDAGQLPAIRSQWHRRLDIQLISVSFAWAVAAALIAPVLWVTYEGRRSRRRGAGQCPSCGYDLTGNESGVCPECGALAASP